jgi:hypothetical protein
MGRSSASFTLPAISLDLSNLSVKVRARPPIDVATKRTTPRTTIGISRTPELLDSQVETGRAECER